MARRAKAGPSQFRILDRRHRSESGYQILNQYCPVIEFYMSGDGDPQEMAEVVGISSCDEASALEPGRLRGVLAQETQRPATERREIRRAASRHARFWSSLKTTSSVQ